MKNNYNNKKAYSFTEILIVFLIIGLISVFSAIIFKKKFAKKDTKIKHGLYACTVFDDEEYFFFSKDKKAAIPTQKEKWTKGKCGSAFVLPNGLMTVKLYGGGGAGGNGKGSWSSGFDGEIFSSTTSYQIPFSGYYDVEIIGNEGSDSYISPFKNDEDTNCIFSYAKHGDSKIFKNTVYLTRYDMFNVSYTDGGSANISLECGTDATIVKKVTAKPGINGADINVNVSSGRFNVTVSGAKAGTYRCNPDNSCSLHYIEQKGDDSTCKNNYGNFCPSNGTTASESDTPGIVKLTWSDRNNSSRTFVAKGGCGGSSGAINTFLYPILSNRLPDISIGKGGKSDSEPTDTKFGSMTAKAGKNNTICSNSNENEKDGSDGTSFSADNVTYNGGAGGTSSYNISKLNGKSVNGFAAGGGGGAIYYTSEPAYDNSKTSEENQNPIQNGVPRWYPGSGGNGGSGLIVITF